MLGQPLIVIFKIRFNKLQLQKNFLLIDNIAIEYMLQLSLTSSFVANLIKYTYFLLKLQNSIVALWLKPLCLGLYCYVI